MAVVGGNKKQTDNTRDYTIEAGLDGSGGGGTINDFNSANLGQSINTGKGSTVTMSVIDGGAVDAGFAFGKQSLDMAERTVTDATRFGNDLFEGAMSFGSDALDMSEAVTNKTITASVDLANASMDTLRSLAADALEGTAAASQRETETAMFALQKANVITGDMPASTIEKLAGYATIAGLVISLYFVWKGSK